MSQLSLSTRAVPFTVRERRLLRRAVRIAAGDRSINNGAETAADVREIARELGAIEAKLV